MKRGKISYIILGILILLSCHSEFADNPNETVRFVPFFYEIVDEAEGLNFFTANPDIAFEETKLLTSAMPGSGAEEDNIKWVEGGQPIIINGRKILVTGRSSAIYIHFSNGDVDTLQHRKATDDKKDKSTQAWLNDPVYFYYYNGVLQGKIDVIQDDLFPRNDIDDPVNFNPYIAKLPKRQ